MSAIPARTPASANNAPAPTTRPLDELGAGNRSAPTSSPGNRSRATSGAGNRSRPGSVPTERARQIAIPIASDAPISRLAARVSVP